MRMKKGLSILGMLFVMVFFVFGCGENKDTQNVKKQNDKTLLVYSGAGLKKPMEKIADDFNKETGVKVEYIFAGSTQLLGQIQTSGKGDVFIVGSKNAYDAAREKNLVEECKEVAYHTPAIITKKGNPKNIKTLEDLQKVDVKVILGDSKASAIGKTSEKIIKKNNLNEIEKNLQAKMPTVNELVIHIVEGKADAAIATIDSVYKNENVEIVKIPEEKNINQILPIATISSSQQKDIANEFVQFVSSKRGKEIFKEYGFKPVN